MFFNIKIKKNNFIIIVFCWLIAQDALLIYSFLVSILATICLIIPFGSTTAPPKYKNSFHNQSITIPVPNAVAPIINKDGLFLCKIRGSYFLLNLKAIVLTHYGNRLIILSEPSLLIIGIFFMNHIVGTI